MNSPGGIWCCSMERLFSLKWAVDLN